MATSAKGYIVAIATRVHDGVEAWKKTGSLGGVPVDLPSSLKLLAGAEQAIVSRTKSWGSVLAKTVSGEPPPPADPLAVMEELGTGEPIDARTSARMEGVFSVPFGQVRIHTDSKGAELSSRLHARAFAVGEHVAFARGQYQPGIPRGDALIAHEFAHVVQQRGSDASEAMPMAATHSGSLETEADAAAALAVTAHGAVSAAGRTQPRPRTGLSLQRCDASTTVEPRSVGGDEAFKLAEANGISL